MFTAGTSGKNDLIIKCAENYFSLYEDEAGHSITFDFAIHSEASCKKRAIWLDFFVDRSILGACAIANGSSSFDH